MRHRKQGRQLSRVRKVRKALIKTLLGSFFLHGKIKTTEAKAREIRPMIDRLVVKAKKATDPVKKVAVIRDLQKYLPKIAVTKLVNEVASQVGDRKSGFARMIKLPQRKSDGAAIAVIELV
ncbi:50S ribosomal protein L17 [Patescibacteria group bacterium]|nr:MAG: 50S ribosomal protein L17 [Patescibacteria group bacterium]